MFWNCDTFDPCWRSMRFVANTEVKRVILKDIGLQSRRRLRFINNTKRSDISRGRETMVYDQINFVVDRTAKSRLSSHELADTTRRGLYYLKKWGGQRSRIYLYIYIQRHMDCNIMVYVLCAHFCSSKGQHRRIRTEKVII